MSPTIVYGPDGKVILALGSAGGKRIIMHVAKTLVGVLDWGLSAKDAIALPNLFFDDAGALIENDAMGRKLAQESAVLGNPFRAEDFGPKVKSGDRTPIDRRGRLAPRSPRTRKPAQHAPPTSHQTNKRQ